MLGHTKIMERYTKWCEDNLHGSDTFADEISQATIAHNEAKFGRLYRWVE